MSFGLVSAGDGIKDICLRRLQENPGKESEENQVPDWFSAALASLALMIVCDGLTHWSKLPITRKPSLLEFIILPTMKYCSWVSLASDAVTSQLTFFLSMHQLLQYKRQQGNFLCFYFAYNTYNYYFKQLKKEMEICHGHHVKSQCGPIVSSGI